MNSIEIPPTLTTIIYSINIPINSTKLLLVIHVDCKNSLSNIICYFYIKSLIYKVVLLIETTNIYLIVADKHFYITTNSGVIKTSSLSMKIITIIDTLTWPKLQQILHPLDWLL